MKDMREIVQDAGMSARPEFYSGRGAIVCDLSSKHLEKIWALLQSEHGSDAAEAFVGMVADLQKLSATDFLNACYRLESAGYKWKPTMRPTENGVDVGPDSPRRGIIATVSIFHALLGDSARDETAAIRGPFLRAHGVKPSAPRPAGLPDWSDEYDGPYYPWD